MPQIDGRQLSGLNGSPKGQVVRWQVAQIAAQVTDDGSHTLASCSPDSSSFEWMDSSNRLCVAADKELGKGSLDQLQISDTS